MRETKVEEVVNARMRERTTRWELMEDVRKVYKRKETFFVGYGI